MTARPTQPEAFFDDLYGFFRQFADIDTSDYTLLDFGCGEKGYVNLYRHHFQRCFALDIVDFTEHYTGNIEFVLSDGREIPLPDRSMHVVVAHSVLEHVEYVAQSMSEINRVLIEGGYAYLTVSPLYFSPSGGHIRPDGKGSPRLTDWEHLNSDSAYYTGTGESLTHTLRGRPLNKLTSAKLLANVGAQPWEILRYRIKAQRNKQLPQFLREGDLSRVDLYVREFRLVARKDFSIVDDEIVMA